jgi:hypothetical protein
MKLLRGLLFASGTRFPREDEDPEIELAGMAAARFLSALNSE